MSVMYVCMLYVTYLSVRIVHARMLCCARLLVNKVVFSFVVAQYIYVVKPVEAPTNPVSGTPLLLRETTNLPQCFVFKTFAERQLLCLTDIHGRVCCF